MSAKLSSPRTELAVLRAACHGDPLVSGTILASVDESYFFSEEAQEALTAIGRLRSELGRSPKFHMLVEDPQLSRKAARFLRNSEVLIRNPNEAKRAVAALGEYRKRRGLFQVAERLAGALDNDKIDAEKLLTETAEMISSVRMSKNSHTHIHIGLNDNSDDLTHKILYEDRSGSMVPTGFKTFDDTNGGFFEGSLVVIAGTTGAGKSTLANQLAVNFAQSGHTCNVVPLEMTEIEQGVRIMATATRFDAMKLLLQRLTKKEKEEVARRWRIWRRRVKDKGGRYTIYKPPGEATIEELFAALAAYSGKVTIIDYLGLLANMSGDDQARALGSAARYGKVYAESTKTIVCVLAQLDEQGRIKYSRAIREHANNSWEFSATAESRDANLINIDQGKARNQKMFSFSLGVDPSMMRVFDLPDGGLGSQGAGDPASNKSLPNLAE